MKKLLGILLSAVMVFSLAACGSSASSQSSSAATADSAASSEAAGTEAAASDLKVGVILVGDETEGYTAAHMKGIKAAAEKLGMTDDQIIWKYKVPESAECSDAAEDLVGQGCNLIVSNSYGHQSYMDEVASKYPDVTFVSMTGDFAALTGLDNFKNAFTNVYESRYVSGVVAGMKVKELVESGTLTPETQPDSFTADGKVKIGYVGAYNYAEVVSGYTAFFLGIKSVYPDVAMEVMYTNSWFDIDKEGAAAEALIANGAVIIGQHADSTGAPAATQKLKDAGKICYSVGYNIDMLATAPTAALTSATNVWKVYYKELFEGAQAGSIPQDWCKGYEDGAVAITDLGPECADGTAEKVAEVEAALKDGSLHVFDTSKFT
ncbi:MAG: BMP family ABC transporter substrate-binding protein, partial [Gemmiger sp.]